MTGSSNKLYLFAGLLLLLLASSVSAQSVDITYPAEKAIFQQVNMVSDIPVSADTTGVPIGGGVEFILDKGTSHEIHAKDTVIPYEYVFKSVNVGEHTLDVYIIDPAGQLSSVYSHRDRIGVGDIIVAMGDSITAGEEDDILTDNWSSDGRVGPYVYPNGPEFGGFEPILTDWLTSIKNYPVVVFNRGIPGALSSDAVTRVITLLKEFPNAKTWLLAYGTNDSNHSISYSTYKSNLQTTINAIHTVIPDAAIYIPKVFFWPNPYVPKYHMAISVLVNNMPNVYWGADLDSLFRANHAQYNHTTGQVGTWLTPTSTHHPNGIGVQKMAMLWKLALVDRITLVTDGGVPSIGGTWTDDVLIEGTDTIGLTKDNLLYVRQLGTPVSQSPAGTKLYGKAWDMTLSSGQSAEFIGGPLKVTMRIENDHITPEGPSSWSQFWLSNNITLLDTTIKVDPVSSNHHDLSALISKKGQVASVVDLEPPVTAIKVNPALPDGTNGWYNTTPVITLTGSDSTGLPVNIYYKWDSGGINTYTGPVTALQGEHTFYYYSSDQSGNIEAAKYMSFKVGQSVVTAPTAPVNESVTPNSGTVPVDTEMVFTTRYSDANGFEDICLAYLLVNYTLNGGKCAYLKYDKQENAIYLRNDANTEWLGGYAPGSNTIIENSYCRLNCAETTINGSGTMMSINWKLTLKSTLAGDSRKAYLTVQDFTRLKDYWEEKGRFSVR